MYELLLKTIADRVNLRDTDQEIISSYFVHKKLRKNQFLLEEGNICNRWSFINTGSLVTYSTDKKGTDHVIGFTFEGGWAGDLISGHDNEKSNITIEAMEPCEILQINAEQQKHLFEKSPTFESYTRIKYQNDCLVLQKRIESSLGLSAEDKYDRFLKDLPTVPERVTLNLIASYLGVAPETLSRIRKSKFLQTQRKKEQALV